MKGNPVNRCVYVATHTLDAPIKVGSHHIAKRIADHYNTVYVPYPHTLLSSLRGPSRQFRRPVGTNCDKDSLRQFRPSFLLCDSDRPFLNSRFICQHGHKWTFPSLVRQIKDLGMTEPELLFLDTNFQSFWIDVLKPRHLVLRVADDPSGFSPHFSKGVEAAWYRSMEKADLVVVPSEQLKEVVQQFAQDVIVCPNGFDPLAMAANAPLPSVYADWNGPVAVYVGAVARWVDLRLIRECAVRLPDWLFVFVGPVDNPESKDMPTNVQFVGPRQHADLAGYLQHANVGIVPFDVDRYARLIWSVDAIKIYEYLSANLQVVCTRWPQSQLMSDLVHHSAQNPDAFSACLTASLTDPKRPASDDELRSWSWDSRVAPITQMLARLSEDGASLKT